MKLKCIKECGKYTIKGKEYEVIEETEEGYVIVDESEEMHEFTKSDWEGTSYKTWFEVVG